MNNRKLKNKINGHFEVCLCTPFLLEKNIALDGSRMRSETELKVICGYSAIELQWLLSSFSELFAVRRALYIKYRWVL